MSDVLNGKTILAGAAIAGLSWSFTRPSGDTTTDYTDSSIALRIYEQNSRGVPVSSTPTLTLSINNGITRSTNTASLQAGTVEISQIQVDSLLGTTAEAKRFGYVWAITPVGGSPLRAFLGEGYEGYFVVAKEGYGGAQLVKVS